METVDEMLAENIETALALSGLTQLELAKRAKISHISLNKVIKKKRPAGKAMVRAIAEALGLAETDLMSSSFGSSPKAVDAEAVAERAAERAVEKYRHEIAFAPAPNIDGLETKVVKTGNTRADSLETKHRTATLPPMTTEEAKALEVIKEDKRAAKLLAFFIRIDDEGRDALVAKAETLAEIRPAPPRN